MLKLVEHNNFKRDYKRAIKQGKDRNKLVDIIKKLQQKIPLDKKHKDHPLLGNYKGYRECHITPDWLLIYQTSNDELVLFGTGSHTYLFD